tara:strand:- start:486 stop:1676 length:1191 start_codon:yes stop_codon:yes gene_type:complete
MNEAQMFAPQISVPATYMRGGTSKGIFFNHADLPDTAKQPGIARDALLQRIIGSPDPYEKQIDGMGGATSSTSKAVIVQASDKPDHDIDYLFGQIAIDQDFVDWSGNCGNLSAAVGPFAIEQGLISSTRIPSDGIAEIRIWQANIHKTIIAHVPISNGRVQETGDFELDGVTFPAAEVRLDFMQPVDTQSEALFPTGNLVDTLHVPDVGELDASMINAGIPTIFINAAAVGYSGTELQVDINADAKALALFEKIRTAGALAMGLIDSPEDAAARQHTPKVAFVSAAKTYTASSGKPVNDNEVDLLVRALSMGKLHHAMMGTAAVAIGAAAAIPGTLVNLAAGGGNRDHVVFGHPSGTLGVGAIAEQRNEGWTIRQASMSRSARIIMEGAVRVPDIT